MRKAIASLIAAAMMTVAANAQVFIVPSADSPWMVREIDFSEKALQQIEAVKSLHDEIIKESLKWSEGDDWGAGVFVGTIRDKAAELDIVKSNDYSSAEKLLIGIAARNLHSLAQAYGKYLTIANADTADRLEKIKSLESCYIPLYMMVEK